jgi:hypothetical protein
LSDLHSKVGAQEPVNKTAAEPASELAPLYRYPPGKEPPPRLAMDYAQRQKTNTKYPGAGKSPRPNTPWEPEDWLFYYNAREAGPEDAAASVGLRRDVHLLFARDTNSPLEAMSAPVNASMLWAILGRNDILVWQGGSNWHISLVLELSRVGEKPHWLPADGNKVLIADNWPDAFGETLQLTGPGKGRTPQYDFLPLASEIKGIVLPKESAQEALKAALIRVHDDYPDKFLAHFKLAGEERARALISFGRQLFWANPTAYSIRAADYFAEALKCAENPATKQYARVELIFTARQAIAAAVQYASELPADSAARVETINEAVSWKKKEVALQQPADPLVHAEWSVPELLCLGGVSLSRSPRDARAYFERALALSADGKREDRRLEALCGLTGALLSLSEKTAAEANLVEAEKLHARLSLELTAAWKQLYPLTGEPSPMEKVTAGSARPDLILLSRLLEPQKTEIKELREKLSVPVRP